VCVRPHPCVKCNTSQGNAQPNALGTVKPPFRFQNSLDIENVENKSTGVKRINSIANDTFCTIIDSEKNRWTYGLPLQKFFNSDLE